MPRLQAPTASEREGRISCKRVHGFSGRFSSLRRELGLTPENFQKSTKRATRESPLSYRVDSTAVEGFSVDGILKRDDASRILRRTYEATNLVQPRLPSR